MSASHRRDCYSAAPPSTFSRWFNRDRLARRDCVCRLINDRWSLDHKIKTARCRLALTLTGSVILLHHPLPLVGGSIQSCRDSLACVCRLINDRWITNHDCALSSCTHSHRIRQSRACTPPPAGRARLPSAPSLSTCDAITTSSEQSVTISMVLFLTDCSVDVMAHTMAFGTPMDKSEQHDIVGKQSTRHRRPSSCTGSPTDR